MSGFDTKLKISTPIILAPMAGITDAAFRLISREMGAGLAVSEMISSYGIYYKNKNTLKLFAFFREEKPVSFQIFGRDPEIMAEAASKLEKIGADYIDINLGCSVPKIKKAGGGSALITNLPLLKKIIKSIKKSINIPLSAKVRILPSKDKTLKLAEAIQSSGANFLTIHGRTPQERFKGKANWDMIKFIKNNIGIPVIGNGDIQTPEAAIKVLEGGYCDAVMIGRAALGNPWIFKNIKETLDGKTSSKITIEEKKETILRHLKLLLEIHAENKAVAKFRKHLAWYSKGIKNSSEFRKKIFLIKDSRELIKAINNFWR